MTTLKAQVPDHLYKNITAFAAKENIPIDQLITKALSAQLLLWKTEDDLLEIRAKRGSWGKFQKVLAKVRDVEPEEYDKL